MTPFDFVKIEFKADFWHFWAQTHKISDLQSRQVSAVTSKITLNQKIWSLYNCLDICIFVAAPGHTFTFQHITEIVEAVTGWKTSTT